MCGCGTQRSSEASEQDLLLYKKISELVKVLPVVGTTSDGRESCRVLFICFIVG